MSDLSEFTITLAGKMPPGSDTAVLAVPSELFRFGNQKPFILELENIVVCIDPQHLNTHFPEHETAEYPDSQAAQLRYPEVITLRFPPFSQLEPKKPGLVYVTPSSLDPQEPNLVETFETLFGPDYLTEESDYERSSKRFKRGLDDETEATKMITTKPKFSNFDFQSPWILFLWTKMLSSFQLILRKLWPIII